MKKNHKEFYSSTISGVELQCKFAFPKIYFTKNLADVNNKVYYDVGFLAEIGWEMNNSATPKYALNSITPIDINPGMSIAEGQVIFKIFHHDSLEKLKEEVLKGINGGKNKIELPEIVDNPFITLEDGIKVEDVTSDPDKINWSQMPLFDIVLLSNTQGELLNKQVRRKVISGVKFTSQGFAESIASLEANSMASFIAIGGISDWELVGE